MDRSRYLLGSEQTEMDRLRTQAALIDEHSAALLTRAGIGPGMQVLDLGSGPGDVSFLLADIVGADGEVIGVDNDEAQIGAAEARRRQLAMPHVHFVQGDAQDFRADRPLDAVVCRLLLMHLPSALDVVRFHLENLRPGGLFVALDYDTGGVRSLPEVPLFLEAVEWLRAGARFADIDLWIGMQLPAILRQAGYQDVDSLGLQAYWGPDELDPVHYLVDTIRAFSGAIVASGAVTERDMDVNTLPSRIADAVTTSSAQYTLATMVGAWGRRPTSP